MAPTATLWGDEIELSWTVENQGAETALASYWYDYVYLSDDEILDDSDTNLTSHYTSDDTRLEAGGSCTATQKVNIPQTEIGDRYIIFASNRDKKQSETNEEDNELALPIRRCWIEV